MFRLLYIIPIVQESKKEPGSGSFTNRCKTLSRFMLTLIIIGIIIYCGFVVRRLPPFKCSTRFDRTNVVNCSRIRLSALPLLERRANDEETNNVLIVDVRSRWEPLRKKTDKKKKTKKNRAKEARCKNEQLECEREEECERGRERKREKERERERKRRKPLAFDATKKYSSGKIEETEGKVNR